MSVFDWKQHSEAGCLSCLTQSNDKGFVNTHVETKLTRMETEIVGFADVDFCADCILQQAKLVGAAMPSETEAFALREYELVTENEKLKDEVEAWRQRMERLIDLKVEDLGLDMPGDEILAETDA
jgi:hypothetical protein